MTSTESTALIVSSICLSIGTIFWISLTRGQIGRILSPTSLSLLMILAIFGLRPILLINSHDYEFIGNDIGNGLALSATVGLVGLIAMLFGRYVAGLHRPKNPKPRSSSTTSSPREIATLVIMSLGLSLAWFAFIFAMGGTALLVQVFEGRNAENSAVTDNVPALIFALPMLASVLSVATSIRARKLGIWTLGLRIIHTITLIICVIPPLALGNRRFLLPSLVAIVIGLLSNRWRKILPVSWALLGAILLLILATIPFVRSTGSRAGADNIVLALIDALKANGVQETLTNLLVSYDTEMFDYIALFGPAIGHSIPVGLGRGTVLEFILAIFPERWFENEKWSDNLLRTIFNASCTEGICPVPSILGTLFYDGHFFGIVIGMIIWGFALRKLEARNTNGLNLDNVYYLLFMAMTLVIVRGNPVSHLAVYVQACILLWIITSVSKQVSKLTTAKGDFPARG